MNMRVLPRPRIDTVAWDDCVAAAPNSILYGYCWYLDAVTSNPDWSWIGLVVSKNGIYQAVMPVPLRRKRGRWVVHQPLFCQFLAIFSRDNHPDATPFFRAMQQHIRYGSVLHCQDIPPGRSLRLQTRPLQTFTLNLSSAYEQLAGNYSHDRSINLRRAEAVNWQVTESDDPTALIQLFQENHAINIPGGVAPWAYDIFRNLLTELHRRGLAILRYAGQDGQIQAGALFVHEGNRIIYLFNAASETGRRGNARTWLIDQLIREKAGRHRPGHNTLILDFESPEKPAIAGFYASFGAVAEPFWEVKYNHLTAIERGALACLRAFTRIGQCYQ